MQRQVIVIGYGSTLRGDDAVGPRAAEAVAAWHRPGVRVIAATQLTPEMAEPVAGARLVLFVDASAEPGGLEVQVRPVWPSKQAEPAGHSCDPRGLLSLARDLFGACPEAWLIAVPSANLNLGEELSEAAALGLDDALRRIAAILEQAGRPEPAHA